MRPADRLPALLAAALLATLAAPMGHAAPREGSDLVQVTALAVAEDAEQSFVGVAATVEAQVLAGGAGRVYVATKPLAQTDMQGSARLASRVAANLLGATWDDYDYLVSFRSDSAVIGGPSAGAVMALALTTALHNLREPDSPWTLDPEVAATGTINPDGTIGPVGGIPAKAEGATAAGITTFLYPAGLDVATTQVRGRTVAVEMQHHCADLGIRCQPAASLVDVLRAAGVDVQQPSAPVPGTTDYASDLGPSVEERVQVLDDRLDRLASDGRTAGLQALEQGRVEEEVAIAEERLASARQAVAEQRYYLAATRAFQGAIQAGRAENLTAFYDAERASQEGVVLAALEGCEDAVRDAESLANPLRASGLTALYAVASAQQRAAQARDLMEQAQAYHSQATRLEDWVQSLFASTFCVERSGTAAWWADLRTTFGAGPALEDRRALAEDAIEGAKEDVAYAEAVLGTDLVAEATAHLTEAEGHAAAGRDDAAVLEAIEARTAASVAMQTAGGASVPAAVLEAAVQGASRAIDTARSAGVEPMLSVSLVELSQDQNQTAQALANLWTARSLALLDNVVPAAQFGDSSASPRPYGADTVSASLVIGAVVGACIVLAAVAVVSLARRK
ncbi:MAG: S16 family serine protease [Thermoplasmatota archaeon]